MDKINENIEKIKENEEKIEMNQPVNVVEDKIETKGLKLKKSTKDRLNMLQSNFDDAESMIVTLLNQYDNFKIESSEKFSDRKGEIDRFNFLIDSLKGCFVNSLEMATYLEDKYAVKLKNEMKMKTKQKIAVPILADREVFDYLKEKVGERKTKTEAFCDLLDKSLAGFVSPFLRNKGYELQPNQCHVTVSDLSSEWHWHRATVRSFLDVMEEFGLLNRIRLSKSVIITMTVQTSQSTESCNGQKKLNLAEQLREALSDWIIGKVSLDEIGIKCEQLVRRAMDEAGICDSCPSPDSITRINPAADDDERAVKIRMVALECITFAAIQRALRKSRFDDSAEFMDYFRLELYGDWTGLIATSKGIAGLILDVDRDENSDYDEDDREFLKTLFKPFLAFAAKAQEATYQIGG